MLFFRLSGRKPENPIAFGEEDKINLYAALLHDRRLIKGMVSISRDECFSAVRRILYSNFLPSGA